MKTSTFAVGVLMCALLMVQAGCGGGGAKSKTEMDVKTTTTGQELLDLKNAYDAGAISKEEYERERQRILQHSQ